MPKAKTNQVIERQWEILNLIPPKKPGITTRALADELERQGMDVSIRSIERDLIDLSRRFALVCNDKGKPYGWYWMNGGGVSLPALTLADALSLRIVEKQLRPLLPEPMLKALESRFSEAKQKLDALSDENPNAQWIKKVGNKSITLQLLPPVIREGVLETVQSALLEDKQLEVDYKRPGEVKPYSTMLHPLGLVQGGPTTYLAATAWKYKDIHYYAVHRIQNAVKTKQDAVKPKHFVIDTEIPGSEIKFGTLDEVKLEAYVSEWLCNILEETPLSHDQVIVPDGDWSRLSATVEDSWQLRWWLLSQGNGIEVLKPADLRKAIKEDIRAALEQYE